MKESITYINEQATEAFNRQAPLFDVLYADNTIIRYKRTRVYDHLSRFLSPASNILELNAGTGDDAIWLARQGHTVHATDISPAMQEMLAQKVIQSGLTDLVSHEICSYTALEDLQNQGPFDHVFSNFAGLNCTDQLEKVMGSLPHLVKPGGRVTLVILPAFCLWETLLLFKGKFKTAFRRFSGKKGAKAHIEGIHFRCWYYNPSFIRKSLKDTFDVLSLEGLCTVVPPSYIEHFAERHPRLYSLLEKKESKWKYRWPWRSIGDYYIITLQRHS